MTTILTSAAVEMVSRNKSPKQLELIARWQKRQPDEVSLRSMDEIAALLGVSTSHVRRHIAAMRADGQEIGLLVRAKAGCDIYLYSETDIEIIEDLLYIANHKRKRSDVPSVY